MCRPATGTDAAKPTTPQPPSSAVRCGGTSSPRRCARVAMTRAARSPGELKYGCLAVMLLLTAVGVVQVTQQVTAATQFGDALHPEAPENVLQLHRVGMEEVDQPL